ncbi:hypothetical protein CLV88_103137 [Shimia abyssi]|uniref:Uncharacterized protein n=1 Tax=Shimia abyssi TaxID=1662395 RepID=A0A2P8FFK6_9RHOB|nr:hypothetical protein CLV88_103137 [Shimia abyssi]
MIRYVGLRSNHRETWRKRVEKPAFYALLRIKLVSLFKWFGGIYAVVGIP